MKEAAKTDGGSNAGRQAISGLSDPELTLLWNRLLLFTARRYFNVDHEDLVIEAFIRVMKGTRRWDLGESPFHNLCGIIRSVAGNKIEKNKKEKKKFTPLSDAPESTTARNLPLLAGRDYSHTEEYERQESDRVFCGRISSLLKDDSLSRRIAEHLLEHPSDKPRKIAEALKVNRGQVYAARKRLMRRLKILTEGWKDVL